MYCVGYTRPVLRASARNSRFQSTKPPPKPLAVTSFKNVVIPSREEILRKRPAPLPIFKPDISYLKHGSSKSLASRLARPQLRDRERARENEKAIIAAKASKPAMLSPDELSQITERRTLERLAREAVVVLRKTEPHPKAHIIRKSIETLTQVPQLPQLPSVQEIGRAPAQNETSLLPHPRESQMATHLTAEQQKAVSDSAARRKSEREARLQRTEALLRKEAAEFEENGYQPARLGSKKLNTRRPEKVYSKELTILENPEVEGDAEGSRPEFTGPPIPSNLLDIFSISYRPSSEQDYTHYANHPPNIFATPPDILGAIRFAEATLSHQRSVALPQRKHAMNLISRACVPKSRQSHRVIG